MLSLKSLTFSGIGRFVEEQTIDFEKLGSLVQVDAKIKNTGRSSGAGKTIIFKSLEFLLGINDIPNSILQSRLTKEQMSVSGVFDFDGIPLKIERNKKLSIDLDGVVTSGSSKLSEEKLDEIIGMPRDLFRKILHKRQGEGGFFLDMGPSDVHKFLTNCLGSQKEQEKVNFLDVRLEALEDRDIRLQSSIESNRTGLEATKNAITGLGLPPVLEIDPGAVEELRIKALYAADTHKMIKDGHVKELEALYKSRPSIISMPYDRSPIERLESEVGMIIANISKLEAQEIDRQAKIRVKGLEATQKLSKLEEDERNRQNLSKTSASQLKIKLLENKTHIDNGTRAREEAQNLVVELQKIRESICPTCEQGWVTDKAKEREAQIVEQVKSLKGAVIAGQTASGLRSELEVSLIKLEEDSLPRPIENLDVLQKEIADIRLEAQPIAVQEAIELRLQVDFKNKELQAQRQSEKDYQFKESTRAQDILAIHERKQTELRKFHEIAIKVVQDEEKRTHSEWEAGKNTIKAYEETKNRFELSLDKLTNQSLSYSVRLKDDMEELASVQEEIELATESKKVIKSYLSASFEDALDSIGDMATRLVRSIPNMSTATIQFEGLKETKEGRVKEEINCMLSMDGEIGIPVKSLSGGERSSVDIAIDLSVIKFIEERTGKGIDLFIMDEAFNGLDTTCIEDAIEMLRNCSVDKRLFLVEHNPVISQSIENRIVVVRDGLTSKVVQE